MRYFLLLLLIACNDAKKPVVVAEDPKVKYQAIYDSARYNARKVFELMWNYTKEAEGKKNIRPIAEKWNKKMIPYQRALDSLKKLLPQDMVNEIDRYRQEMLTQIENSTFK